MIASESLTVAPPSGDTAMRPLSICLMVGSMAVGGVQVFLLQLGRYLVEAGHSVTVVTTRTRGEWWSRLAAHGISGICIAADESLAPVTHARRLGRFLSKSTFDVVLLNHVREAHLILGSLSASTAVIPVVHNDTSGIFGVATSNPQAWNALVAVCPKLATQAAIRLPEKPIRQIDYAVEAPSELQWEARRKWEKQCALLYVGRLVDEQKGILLLPEILRHCRKLGVNARLSVVGDGADASRLQRAFDAAGCSSQVRFWGNLSPEQSLEQMLEHHILIMPSRYEGLGIVAIEAQACGCVPIATRLARVTDHSIRDNETGFLVPGDDCQAFAERIAQLSSNQGLWNEMSLAGRQRVLQAFTVRAMAESYLELFREAIFGRHPARRRGGGPLAVELLTWRDFVPNVLRRLRRA